MSKYGKGIINRLHPLSPLHNKNNEGRLVIDNTIGEYLDNFEKRELTKELFLFHATGKYLDLHGHEYGVPRKEGESDETYRQRILLERGMHNSISDFKNRGVEFWDYVEGLGAGSIQFFIQICDEDGIFLKDVNVNLAIEDEVTGKLTNLSSKSNSSGLTYFNISNISQILNLTYTVNYGEEYNESTANLTINKSTLFKQNTLLWCNDSDIIRHSQFKVKLVTSEGRLLSDKTVKISVNGVTYSKITDDEGIARLDINLLEGDYDITYEFEGDEEYNACEGKTLIHDFSEGSNKKNLYINSGMLLDVQSSVITSKNVYIDNKYLAHATSTIQQNLNQKFINGDSIVWF